MRDTKKIIQILDALTSTTSSILVTADIGSLYTIINHDEALASVKWALSCSDLSRKHRKFLLNCLECCLLNNYFWFDRRYVQQTRRVAMGARFSPSVANLFMANWEEDIVFKDRPSHLVCYRRYIDDLIMIWKGDMVSLELFMNNDEQ